MRPMWVSPMPSGSVVALQLIQHLGEVKHGEGQLAYRVRRLVIPRASTRPIWARRSEKLLRV